MHACVRAAFLLFFRLPHHPQHRKKKHKTIFRLILSFCKANDLRCADRSPVTRLRPSRHPRCPTSRDGQRGSILRRSMLPDAARQPQKKIHVEQHTLLSDANYIRYIRVYHVCVCAPRASRHHQRMRPKKKKKLIFRHRIAASLLSTWSYFCPSVRRA